MGVGQGEYPGLRWRGQRQRWRAAVAGWPALRAARPARRPREAGRGEDSGGRRQGRARPRPAVETKATTTVEGVAARRCSQPTANSARARRRGAGSGEGAEAAARARPPEQQRRGAARAGASAGAGAAVERRRRGQGRLGRDGEEGLAGRYLGGSAPSSAPVTLAPSPWQAIFPCPGPRRQ